MIVIPAIDLRGGRCVRLVQGDYSRETVYSDDPVRVARRWAECGARWLHVVDLDGARAGQPLQVGLVEQVVRAVPELSVQVGGGLRSLEAIERVLMAGAARVVLGTAAIERPEFVAEAVRLFGADRIVVAVDSRAGRVATHGWETLQPVHAVDVVRRMVQFGVRRVLATDVARDGTLMRPNVELMADLAALGVAVIASGGVSSRADLEVLAQVRGVEAVVVGRALYEGRLRCQRPEEWIVDAGAV